MGAVGEGVEGEEGGGEEVGGGEDLGVVSWCVIDEVEKEEGVRLYLGRVLCCAFRLWASALPGQKGCW